MNILPNTIIVFPDSFDSMRQFNLELKYSSSEYIIYELGEREQKEIHDRLLATGIPYIYVPDNLSSSIIVNYYIKIDGQIEVRQEHYPLMNMISFNRNEMDSNMNKSVSKEQFKLGSKYSIVELLSGE